MGLPLSPGGWVAALAATTVAGLPAARRALRDQLAGDAGLAGMPTSYECAVWVGWDEIRAAAAVIRRERSVMISDPNPLDHLEYALSEVASLSSDDNPPVLLLGCLPVTGDPLVGQP